MFHLHVYKSPDAYFELDKHMLQHTLNKSLSYYLMHQKLYWIKIHYHHFRFLLNNLYQTKYDLPTHHVQQAVSQFLTYHHLSWKEFHL